LAARRPLIGRDEVVKFLIGIQRSAGKQGLLAEASLTIDEVNAEPALVLRVGQRLESIFGVSVHDDAVSAMRVVRKPDKLEHIERRLKQVH
jgi:RNA polymerase sigma-70 factor (ECF subfamily)